MNSQLAVPAGGQFLGCAEVCGQPHKVIACFDEKCRSSNGTRVVELIVPCCPSHLIGRLIKLDLLSPIFSLPLDFRTEHAQTKEPELVS